MQNLKTLGAGKSHSYGIMYEAGKNQALDIKLIITGSNSPIFCKITNIKKLLCRRIDKLPKSGKYLHFYQKIWLYFIISQS